MRTVFVSVSVALSLLVAPAKAGNLDRTKTSINIIFESGNYAELSFGYVNPDITGADALGNPISDVGGDFGIIGGGIKLQFHEKLSFALIYDQPYGADTVFGGSPAVTLLGGTTAKATTDALTILLGYDVSDRMMIFGGPRVVGASGDVSLAGQAYGPLSGYKVNFASDRGLGYVVGAAYEIPDIAFRAALIYHSAVDLDMQTTETFPGGAPIATGPTKSSLPQSLKFQLQSGIAENTLVFGSIRWSDWNAFTLDPPSVAPNLAVMEDAWTYEIGLGYRFTEDLSASVTYSYEHENGNNLVSPLAPTKGFQTISLGGKYKLTDAVDMSAGVQYSWLGNALPETSPQGVVRANFKNNDAIAVGIKLGMSF